jgi:hypothetical protein
MDYGPRSLDEVRSFLEGPHRAVLSTIGRDGSPHLAVVDYLVERRLGARYQKGWLSASAKLYGSQAIRRTESR